MATTVSPEMRLRNELRDQEIVDRTMRKYEALPKGSASCSIIIWVLFFVALAVVAAVVVSLPQLIALLG